MWGLLAKMRKRGLEELGMGVWGVSVGGVGGGGGGCSEEKNSKQLGKQNNDHKKTS